MAQITKSEMLLLDKLYVERYGEPELEPLLAELRELVLGTTFPGNIVPRTDPDFLARYLRVRDYDIRRAYKNVQSFYRCVFKHMPMHKGLKPSDVASVFHSKTADTAILKHRFNGVTVGYARIKDWDPKEYKLVELQKAAAFGAEHYLKDIGIQRHGVTGIADLSGLRFEHLWHATIKEIRQCAEAGLKGTPVRLIQGHAINVPRIFWPIYNFGKRFVKQKFLDRVHFHENLESLHKYFDKRFLPESLGGDLTEEDAYDKHVAEEILKQDVPYEAYWNGAIWKPSPEELMRIRHMSAELRSD